MVSSAKLPKFIFPPASVTLRRICNFLLLTKISRNGNQRASAALGDSPGARNMMRPICDPKPPWPPPAKENGAPSAGVTFFLRRGVPHPEPAPRCRGAARRRVGPMRRNRKPQSLKPHALTRAINSLPKTLSFRGAPTERCEGGATRNLEFSRNPGYCPGTRSL